MTFLRPIAFEDLPVVRYNPIDQETLLQTKAIVDSVQCEGAIAVRRYGMQFGEIDESSPLVISRHQLLESLNRISSDSRALLERTAERIRHFATAQRKSILEMTLEVPGGIVGTKIRPVEIAGCYAPGGRYPLPSSVLMTAVTAREAGVKGVWVASPNPNELVMAAAAVAGADGLIPVGGAHAIASLAFGAGPIPRCNMIVGPGNRWVTAAKQLLFGTVGIDMLAGPSELVIVADSASNPAFVAADLLAQAEHDPDALPILVLIGQELAKEIELELSRQMETLPTAATAAQALRNGLMVHVSGVQQAIAAANILAPEHLQLHVRWSEHEVEQLDQFGALFIGDASAEVLGDYGMGPNHVLPTSGTARFTGGLSVLTFLRSQTWMKVVNTASLDRVFLDAEHLGTLEGLHAHARAAKMRRKE